jgi:predicted site-specific integrase-resolvase
MSTTPRRKPGARKQGISYQTAWRWVRQGKMPVPFEQTPTGTILVKEPKATSQAVALYARMVSESGPGSKAKKALEAIECEG